MRSPLSLISPAVGSISLRIAFPAVDLPQPALADEAQRLAGADLERNVVDRVDLADRRLQECLP